MRWQGKDGIKNKDERKGGETAIRRGTWQTRGRKHQGDEERAGTLCGNLMSVFGGFFCNTENQPCMSVWAKRLKSVSSCLCILYSVFKMLSPTQCADIISFDSFSYSITALNSCAHGRVYNEVGFKNLWVSMELTDWALVIHTRVTLGLSSICRLRTQSPVEAKACLCSSLLLVWMSPHWRTNQKAERLQFERGFGKLAAPPFGMWNYPRASGQKGVSLNQKAPRTSNTSVHPVIKCFNVSHQDHWTLCAAHWYYHLNKYKTPYRNMLWIFMSDIDHWVHKQHWFFSPIFD